MTLSKAEREVALALCRGLTDKEVANILFRSYHTVRTQKKGIYRKVGVTKDTELMAAMICERKKHQIYINKVKNKRH